MCDFFGGPSKQEETNADQTQSFANTLQGSYSTEFQEQQGALNTLNTLNQRIATGDTGYGFSPTLNADLTSQIQNRGAAEAQNLTQSAMNARAGQVFGGPSGTDSSGLARASGITSQLREMAQSKAATDTSNQLAQENIANINAGRENITNAANQEQNIVRAYNPAAYAQLAGSELSQAGQDYKNIQAEKVAKAQAIGKLALSAVTSAATFGMGGLGAMGPGAGIGQFFKGGVNALSGGANPFSIDNASPAAPNVNTDVGSLPQSQDFTSDFSGGGSTADAGIG